MSQPASLCVAPNGSVVGVLHRMGAIRLPLRGRHSTQLLERRLYVLRAQIRKL